MFVQRENLARKILSKHLKKKIFNSFSSSRNPWFFVPSLYFAEGLPYVLVNTVSVILYKRLGIANAKIAFWTELVAFVWVFKMCWGPLVDTHSTQRNWIVGTQGVLFIFILFIAFSLSLTSFFLFSLLALSGVAFFSATHDIAVDGFYLLSLSKEEQSFYVGIRSLFYRIAMIFGSGALVYTAGSLEASLGNVTLSWTVVLILASLFMGLLSLYHRWVLPFPDQDAMTPVRSTFQGHPFLEIIFSYFRQKKIGGVLLFILLYRFGEAMLVKMVAPFLLDKREMGGMALTTAQVGLIYGTLGVLGLIAGGILGGILISKLGLKICIWPMALALNLPDLLYVYLAYVHPPLYCVGSFIVLEQFGYGIGFTAFTVFLMQVSKGRYPTSHFAISTGIMALGMRIPGMVSGYLQQVLGYPLFFIAVCFVTLPGMLLIPFLPLEDGK
ncbi:MAG: MFS transporter [Chlamydiae bacterium]|nr:MFS transporter [Chlamydiota bacterium]MBI3265595.1 MFS transporter [Chlamydiota bacterium]